MEKFLRDNRIKRRSTLKLNLKPTGIQAIARSKLKLKRPAEDDVEQVKKSKLGPVSTARLKLDDRFLRDQERKPKSEEESLEELIEDYDSQNEEHMENTAEQTLPDEERSNSSLLSSSRYDVSQIKNLQLNRTIEEPRRCKNNWKRMKFKEVSKDKVSLQ